MPNVRSSFVRFAVAFTMSVALAGNVFGQVNIYNSNGFDSGFATGNLIGQQSFIGEPTTATAFQIQNGTFQSSGQAVQITGPNLNNNTGFFGGNFAYQTRPSTGAGVVNPVASGNQFVVASFSIQTPQTLILPTDIPFAGLHMEGYHEVFPGVLYTQQALSPVMVGVNGEILVFTDQTTGGPNKALFTDTGLVPRGNVWTKVTTEFNFASQTFRVLVNDTPVQFKFNGGHGAITPITNVPFRNTNGPTNLIAELGLVAFYGTDPFGGGGTPVQPLNNVFIDDLNIVMQTTPVPEPGTILAVAAVGFFGIRTWRRRRAA